MSHIFISYSRSDTPHLDKLLAWLKDNNFSDHEIWYDDQIESGNNWRTEITKALNEAYAVLVIVSENSLKSQYCTYEWAYAAGQDIPILPLVFESVILTDVPAPLAARPFTSCIERISDDLREQIMRLRSVPPQVAAINKFIYDTLCDTHRRYFVLSWIGKNLGNLDYQTAQDVVSYFADHAADAYTTLEALMIEKAFALTAKQHRLCWILSDFLKDFLRLDYDSSFYDELPTQVDSKWLNAFEYFEGRRKWRIVMGHYFDLELKNDHPRMEVIDEIISAFPILTDSDVDVLIQNKSVSRQQRKRETQVLLIG